MSPALAWAHAQGLDVPQGAEAIETGIVVALIIVSLAIGLFAGRWLGPHAEALWQRHLGHHVEHFGGRVAAVIRHGVAAFLLAILLVGGAWPPLAEGVIGFFLGAAVARMSIELLRGLNIPRWMAWSVAFFLFVAIFSHSLGGFAPIRATLTAIGFDVGKTHLSVFSVIVALLTVVGLLAGVRLANRLIGHAILSATGFDPTQKLLTQKLAGIAVVALAFFVGIDLLDINLTSLAVFSGALGLAVGFGLQKTVGNLIAGIILLLDRSIKPGDVIVVADKEVGWVNKIGVRAVSVITRDGKEHLIPNEDLMTKEVENWSYTDRNVRIRIPVAVSYDCDLKLAQQLMLRAAAESPRVLDDPKSNIWLTEFGDNGVKHEILVWINDPQSGVGSVRSDVLNRLWVLFKDNGITIPYPQRDVRIVRDELGSAPAG
ncbi:mechanosensitive ion channel family protein [Sphingomonas sp.]|jgi:small-conductance mechanosensitive channel|uniref:mechanosensitive ion channel family protein n=1 Tax=Sphingomonas sp. TaxID=28214 RepID=UPI002E373334|nr:mechanosensitive ion channel domain-containing protein [Sphingomonas sp.]HEX4694973.1 mechanosensitive ion channel domain-containing protein [Sphingomonas sp.]